MFQPTKELQVCAGLSMLLLCGGGAVSMVSGSVVQFRVAGANFSVNQKLEQVERIKETLENTTTKLKREPKVNRRKISQIEKQLQSVGSIHDDTEKQVHQDLEGLANPRGN